MPSCTHSVAHHIGPCSVAHYTATHHLLQQGPNTPAQPPVCHGYTLAPSSRHTHVTPVAPLTSSALAPFFHLSAPRSANFRTAIAQGLRRLHSVAAAQNTPHAHTPESHCTAQTHPQPPLSSPLPHLSMRPALWRLLTTLHSTLCTMHYALYTMCGTWAVPAVVYWPRDPWVANISLSLSLSLSIYIYSGVVLKGSCPVVLGYCYNSINTITPL